MKPIPDGYGRLILPTGATIDLTPEQSSALLAYMQWARFAQTERNSDILDEIDWVRLLAHDALRLRMIGKPFSVAMPAVTAVGPVHLEREEG